MSNILTLALGATPSIAQDSAILQQALNSVKITDELSFARVADIVRDCGDAKKSIEGFFEQPRELAHKAHKSITERIATMVRPFETIANAGKANMKAFRDEQRRVEQQRAAEIERAAREERERLEREAREARKRGEMAAAREIVAQAEMVVAEAPTPVAAKVAGIQEPKSFKADVMEPMELIKAIASGKVDLIQQRSKGAPEPLVRVNETLISDMARRLGLDLKLPGVKVYEDFGIRVGRR